MVDTSTGGQILQRGLQVWFVDGCHRLQVLQELLEKLAEGIVNASRKCISKPLRVSAVRHMDRCSLPHSRR